jgi:thymidylate synthase
MIDLEYKCLIATILNDGESKNDRTEVGTKSLFGQRIWHDMRDGFPILTCKKVSFHMAKVELLWILNGRTDLKYLKDNGVNYWDADYKRSGRSDGNLGPVYGKQWRDFKGIDQLKNLVDMINSDPMSRRLMVSAWAPDELNQMVLPPCHHGFQINIVDGYIDLMWTQRSADVFLGLPYDIVMYGLLLELLALGTGYKARHLVGMLGDTHIYNNHIEQAQELLRTKTYELPKLELKKGIVLSNKKLYLPELTDISLSNYTHGKQINAKLNVGK